MKVVLYAQLGSLEGHLAAQLARFGQIAHHLEPQLAQRDFGASLPALRWVEANGDRLEGAKALESLRVKAQEVLGTSSEDQAAYSLIETELVSALEVIESGPHQDVYEAVCRRYFAALEAFDEQLETRRYLSYGDRFGAADLFLLAILVRHDSVFYPFYKLSLARLDDFRNLGHYARDLAQLPGFADLIQLREARRFYAWQTNELLNPKRRVPTGGWVDFWEPHDRHARFGTHPIGTAGVEESQLQIMTSAWVRPRSAHRDTIEAPVVGRYHLYVSHNCPWSHRVTLARSVLGLEDVVSLDVVFYRRHPERGWQFRPQEDGCTPDSVWNSTFVREIYEREGSQEKSVPILYDKQEQRVVNNESSEILRMLGTVFKPFAQRREFNFYPKNLRTEIDQVNQWIYQRINNGAYKAGFSSGQEAYEDAAEAFFFALERLDYRLSDGRAFLLGETLTESDLRLFPTIYRFDDIYYIRFLLNRHTLDAYPYLERWRGRMLEIEGVEAASRLDHCKKGYFGRTGNNLVPLTSERWLKASS